MPTRPADFGFGTILSSLKDTSQLSQAYKARSGDSKYGQILLLKTLRDNGPQQFGQLPKASGISPGDLLEVMDPLIGYNLIKVVSDAGGSLVEITDDGQEFIKA
ncbi:MAG: hypothetical protein AAF797_14885 [Planctomycetota bacterium]